MKKYLLFIITILLLTSCAQSVDVQECVTVTYGFWSGVWHGFILMFSFIGSLFNDSISVYAVNNTGGWYDFGFILGLGGIIPSFFKLIGNIILAALK